MLNKQRKQIFRLRKLHVFNLISVVVFSIVSIIVFEDLSLSKQENKIGEAQNLSAIQKTSDEIDKKIHDSVEKQKEALIEKVIEKVRNEAFDKVKGDIYSSILYPIVGVIISLFALVLLKDGIISILNRNEQNRIAKKIEERLKGEIEIFFNKSNFSRRLQLIEIQTYWKEHDLSTIAMYELSNSIKCTKVDSPPPSITFDIRQFFYDNIKEFHKDSRVSLYSMKDEMSIEDLGEIIGLDESFFSDLVNKSCLQIEQQKSLKQESESQLQTLKKEIFNKSLRLPTSPELTEHLFTRQMVLLISKLLEKNEYEAAEKFYKYMKEEREKIKENRKKEAHEVANSIFK